MPKTTSGKIDGEVRPRSGRALLAEGVPRLGKIIDVSGSPSELTVEQVERIAKMLHGNADEKRGLAAFVINPDRIGFAHAFADATKTDRPVKLFRSLHDARAWLLDQMRR